MKTIGIIAEFNPFHNGHAYIINQAKRETGADHAVIIMSGNYVQRGAPAFMDKFSRTEIALNNGADLVIELPTVYAMSSASYFATGAVKILDSLNTIDYLCFGCEINNLELLELIVDIILLEDELYSSTLQTHLKSGLSFAKSRENAIIKSLSLRGYPYSTKEISDILTKPNSILAIEYIKALKQANSKIKPYLIKRTDHGYLSLSLEGGYASSSAIRNMYTKKSVYNFNNIRETLSLITPYNSLQLLEKNFRVTYPIERNDFTSLIGKSLINDKFGLSDMNELFDSTPDLINRLRNYYNKFKDIDSFVNTCNSPSFTSSRISRLLFYSIINYFKKDFFNFKDDGYVYYYRVLGFKKSHSDLLTHIKENSDYPMITKITKANEYLSENALRMLEINRLADDIYRVVILAKYGTEIPTEEQTGVIIIE